MRVIFVISAFGLIAALVSYFIGKCVGFGKAACISLAILSFIPGGFLVTGAILVAQYTIWLKKDYYTRTASAYSRIASSIVSYAASKKGGKVKN
jgi:hypothetical protein